MSSSKYAFFLDVSSRQLTLLRNNVNIFICYKNNYTIMLYISLLIYDVSKDCRVM